MQKSIIQPNHHATVRKEGNMPVKISTECGKQKKCMDKNFELEAELKLAHAENALLRQELEELRSGRVQWSLETRPDESFISKQEMTKMQGAFQAMKNLLISQEESLHSLRTEVLQSRKRVREQDQMLDYFKTQLAAYKNTEKAHTAAKTSSQTLAKQVERLEQAFARERGKNAKLLEELKEKNKAIESLRARLEKKVQRRMSEFTMISRKESGTSTQGRRSCDLGLIRRKSTSGIMMDVKSLASKRTATTATTSSSYPSKSSTSERSLDNAIHCARSNLSEENWGKLSRKASIRKKSSRSKQVPSTASSSSSPFKEKKLSDAQVVPSKFDEKKKTITRRKSDLSMIRKTSSCQHAMDTDSRSMTSRRTARSCSSRSQTSAANQGAARMDTYVQAIREGRGVGRREISGTFESNGAAAFGGFEGDDNHSIKEGVWSPQGSYEEVFEDNDMSDEDFW